MTTVDLRFPILAIKEGDKMLYTFKNDKVLKYTSERLLSIGIFKNVVYIDSNLKQFHIKQVVKLGYAGLFGFNPFLKGRQIKISIEFEPEVKEIDLQSFKEIILNKINSNKSFWKNTWDLNQLTNLINDAQNAQDIINIIN